MDGLLSLKWNNHSIAFLKKFATLRRKEIYCDATIACQDKYFPVHKLILSTCSDYFQDIFEKIQCKHPFIIIKDIAANDMETLLNYMYQGEVNVLQEFLPGLIKAAEALKVKGLAVPDDEPSSVSKRSHSSSDVSRHVKRHKKSELVKKNVDDRIEKCSSNCLPLSDKDTNDDADVISDKIKEEPIEASLEKVDDFYENTEMKSEEKQDTPSDSVEDLGSQTVCKSDSMFENQYITAQCSSWDGTADVPSDNSNSSNIEAFDGINDQMPLSDSLYAEPAEPAEPNPDFEVSEPYLPEEPVIGCKNSSQWRTKCNKVYTCPFCPYTSDISRINVHVKRHTGEKPHSCPLCSYRSVQRSKVKRHMIVHKRHKRP